MKGFFVIQQQKAQHDNAVGMFTFEPLKMENGHKLGHMQDSLYMPTIYSQYRSPNNAPNQHKQEYIHPVLKFFVSGQILINHDLNHDKVLQSIESLRKY